MYKNTIDEIELENLLLSNDKDKIRRAILIVQKEEQEALKWIRNIFSTGNIKNNNPMLEQPRKERHISWRKIVKLKERLKELESNNEHIVRASASINSENSYLIQLLEEFSVEVNSNLEILHSDLLFLKNAGNLVIGDSKAGKTFTTIKSLVDSGFKNSIIHIDFDRNADIKLQELGVKTFHIGDNQGMLEKLSQAQDNLILNSHDDQIIIIDSLQDLASTNGYDTNSGALEMMNRVLKFKDTGATIIVIHHVTVTDIKTGDFKIKGNSTTITSKCDTAIAFTRQEDTRVMQVLKTRAEDKIASGSKLTYLKADMLKTGESNEVPK